MKRKFFALIQPGGSNIGVAFVGHIRAKNPEDAADMVGMTIGKKYLGDDGKFERADLAENGNKLTMICVPEIDGSLWSDVLFILKRKEGGLWKVKQYLRAKDLQDAIEKLGMKLLFPYVHGLSKSRSALLSGGSGERYSIEELRPYCPPCITVMEEFPPELLGPLS